MAINNTLSDVDQATFENFEAIVIDLLRTDHPTLDVKTGTALRELLVRPNAELSGLNDTNNQELRQQLSLELMATAAAQDEDVLNALLSNFQITRRSGTIARGSVIVYSSENRSYLIPERSVFTINELQYESDRAWSVTDDVTDPDNELLLRQADDGGYFFIVPVSAAAAGSEYNVGSGNDVIIEQDLGSGILDAAVYTDISGGEDQETLEELVARVPQSIAFKVPVSDASISATLMDRFESVKDVSVVGMGDEEMLRDKHNLFNIAVGSRVDVYVRTAKIPTSVIIEKDATKLANGVYTFTIDKEDIPGFYTIRAITSPESVITYDGGLSLPAVGSYPFSEIRSADGINETFHDISPDNLAVETAYTVWQTSTVTVNDVPANDEGIWPDTLTLKAEIYYPKDLDLLQEFMDDTVLRNNEADYIVRGAVPCFVSVRTTVFVRPGQVLDVDLIKADLVDYINTKKFGDVLTVSQLSSVIHNNYDIIRVGLDDVGSTGMLLEGTIRAADGTLVNLSGNSLDIADYAVPELLVSDKTCVFMTDPRNIFIKVRTL